MTYDAILFDLDGVLITGRQTPDAVYRLATEEMLRAFGRGADAWPDALQDPEDADAFREASLTVDLPADAAWGYRERAATDIAHGRRRDRGRTAYADTTVLERLAGEYALGVCSNNRHDSVREYIERNDWGGHVDAFRGRLPTLPDFDRRKPDPSYLEWLVDRMGVERPLIVGDRVSDVRTATRAGWDAALLTRGDEPASDRVRPAYRLDSLDELADLDAPERAR